MVTRQKESLQSLYFAGFFWFENYSGNSFFSERHC